ncbi:MAG TPA: tryptophan--tRNA ligase [Defluviitaleaceae bacterium]|nr:tryptophan--tRNA ligase [Candidatus Epulonipiscium sp.]HOQ15761.1 tryptophan--tRNA ligase [Defluviitaleaceae bacterium]HPT77008.1 tryptophan--tRNA ligase [Defluviitaleaceae bacterium]HQD49523.1 tryptophan--tRNA ligase [Defluviitaleaceae bacterium]
MTAENQKDKKVIFSGMQPSGNITLGNYLGALKNWTKLQDEYNCVFCIVDLHALTVRQDPAELRRRSREVLMLYIAAGLDPEKNIIYYQSHVGAHAELAWILNCYTYMGELNRMTQFKEKSQKHSENINAGLFTYPVLMAADILLYQANLVPVGNDQSQHLELCRDVAIRFNNLYGETFIVPEGYFPKVGARIMSLQDPTKKMSKSDENENSYITLLDSPDTILRKIKKAVTDSEAKIAYRDEQPGIKNLLNIYCSITEEPIEKVVERFSSLGYGELKAKVAEVVVEELRPIQERFYQLEKDKSYIDSIIKNNAERASRIAYKTLSKVQRKIGLPAKIR